jgi:hypothetical protein
MPACSLCCLLPALLSAAPGTGRARLANLERAKHQLTVFMQKCERVTLLKGEDLKAWEEKVRQGAWAGLCHVHTFLYTHVLHDWVQYSRHMPLRLC